MYAYLLQWKFLKKMLDAVSLVVETFYLQVAVKSIFSLAFFALLWPVEITTRSQKRKKNFTGSGYTHWKR